MFYDVQCCNRCGLSVPHIFHWSELTQGPVSGEGGNRVPAGVRENEEEADCWRERERERGRPTPVQRPPIREIREADNNCRYTRC